MKKCIKCGREILDRAKICPYCSKEQISSSNENREEVTENKEPINTEEMPEKTVILRKSSLQKEKFLGLKKQVFAWRKNFSRKRNFKMKI